jgi:hypothetical protein
MLDECDVPPHVMNSSPHGIRHVKEFVTSLKRFKHLLYYISSNKTLWRFNTFKEYTL